MRAYRPSACSARPVVHGLQGSKSLQFRTKDLKVSRLSIGSGPGAQAVSGKRGSVWLRRASLFAVSTLLVGTAGCAVATPEIPAPRPIVIHSGVRINADHDEMKEVNEWVTREQQNIVEDPSFWVIGEPVAEEVYPWEDLRISNDSVWVQVDLRAPDTRLVHEIYAHLHLMSTMGRQEEWLPEAPDAVGYELERAILKRCADAWILGRTVFDTAPYGPLDELAYASNAGYLDAFIFTARPDEFASSRAEWARANPGRADEYREWFLDTFSREPPGVRSQ